MNLSAMLRCSMSTSSPSGASRTSVTVAAGSGVTSVLAVTGRRQFVSRQYATQLDMSILRQHLLERRARIELGADLHLGGGQPLRLVEGFLHRVGGHSDDTILVAEHEIARIDDHMLLGGSGEIRRYLARRHFP